MPAKSIAEGAQIARKFSNDTKLVLDTQPCVHSVPPGCEPPEVAFRIFPAGYEEST